MIITNHYTFILRSSLNVKSTTIIEKPSSGSLITSSSTLMNIIVVSLKPLDRMSLGYVSFFFPSLLSFQALIPGIQLEACNGWAPNAPWTFRKLQIVEYRHWRHQCTYWWHSSWSRFEWLVQVYRHVYPQGIFASMLLQIRVHLLLTTGPPWARVCIRACVQRSRKSSTWHRQTILWR